MCLKKCAISYVIWAIMLLCLFPVMCFWGVEAARLYVKGNIWATIGLVIGFGGILFLLFYLTGILLRRIAPRKRRFFIGFKIRITEAILVVTFILTAILIRNYCMSAMVEDMTYFNLAKVGSDDKLPVQFVQGSVYYYCTLLHGAFLVFGNHFEVGIWLQIILQAFASLFMYLAVRKLSGRACAMLVLLYMCFSRTSMDEGLRYSPNMLYLCLFSLAFLFCAVYIKHSEKEEEHPVFMWICTVLLGVSVGFVCYVDVSGVILLVLLACLGWVKRGVGKSALWFLRYVIITVMAILTFLMSLFMDGVLSGTSFVRVFNAWFVTYGSFNPSFAILTIKRQMDFLWLPAISCIGLFSFWRRKRHDVFSPYVLMAFGLMLLCFLGITVETMDGTYLLFVLLAGLASVSVTELFHRNASMLYRPRTEAVNADIAFEVYDEKMEMMDLEKKETTNKNEQMIENPLPVPKKRERKVMDYAFEPQGIQMVYDIRVSDKDDFDI